MNKHTYNICPSGNLHVLVITCAALAVSLLTGLGADDAFSRKGKIDLLFPGVYLKGDGWDAAGGGFAVNGHLTDHFGLGLEGAIGGADVGRDDGFFYTALFSVEYNLLKSRFTPFVTASGGILGFEINSGGWIFGETKETTHGAFGGGVGVRWDLTDHFFMKGAYRALVITGGPNDGVAHSLTLGVGFSF